MRKSSTPRPPTNLPIYAKREVHQASARECANAGHQVLTGKRTCCRWTFQAAKNSRWTFVIAPTVSWSSPAHIARWTSLCPRRERWMDQIVRRASCACGRVSCEGAGGPILSAICYCADCQEGGRRIEALSGARPVLEPDGGTAYLTYRAATQPCFSNLHPGSGFRLTAAGSRATCRPLK